MKHVLSSAAFFVCLAVPVAARAGDASFDVAAGGSCAAELAHFQQILQSDLDTGNVNKSVYAQMQRELGGATRACEAGREGEALGIIRATKARHGYRSDA